MAVLTAPKSGRRRPSFRGALVFRTQNGQVIAQAWPKKPGPKATPKQVFQREWFRQANILAKYAPARQQALSRCAMDYLPVRPYDALISAMAGRLWAVETDDKGTLYSMASRSDVSKNLDILSPKPSAIMCRGGAFWEGAEPTAEGQLYISGPPGECGTFRDVPGGAIPAALLRRTSNQYIPPNTGTYINWQAVDFEDWTAWNPAEPSRLYVKPGTTRFRATLSLQIAGPLAGGKLDVRITQEGGYVALDMSLRPNDPALTLVSNITLAAPGDGIYAWVKSAVGMNIYGGTGSGFGIEAMDAP